MKRKLRSNKSSKPKRSLATMAMDRALRWYDAEVIARVFKSKKEREAIKAVLSYLSLHSCLAWSEKSKGRTLYDCNAGSRGLDRVGLDSYDALVMTRLEYDHLMRVFGVKS